MANTIALRKAYSTMLDEVYKLASLTAVLDGPNELVREGANANEILIPKMSMQGLANYNKQTGYVAGDVTLEYETKKCGYDRDTWKESHQIFRSFQYEIPNPPGMGPLH